MICPHNLSIQNLKHRMLEKHAPPPLCPVESYLQLPRVPGNSPKTTGHSRWPFSSLGGDIPPRGGGHGVHLLPGTVLSPLYQGTRRQCLTGATSFLCQVGPAVVPTHPPGRHLVLPSSALQPLSAGAGGGAAYTRPVLRPQPSLPDSKDTCQLGSKARATPDQRR